MIIFWGLPKKLPDFLSDPGDEAYAQEEGTGGPVFVASVFLVGLPSLKLT